jgi:hypothetical protein
MNNIYIKLANAIKCNPKILLKYSLFFKDDMKVGLSEKDMKNKDLLLANLIVRFLIAYTQYMKDIMTTNEFKDSQKINFDDYVSYWDMWSKLQGECHSQEEFNFKMAEFRENLLVHKKSEN